MLEDLKQYHPRSKGLPCKVRSLLETLSESDRNILVDAMEDERGWSTNGLFTALSKKGIDLGYQSIRRHRLNLCSCRHEDA